MMEPQQFETERRQAEKTAFAAFIVLVIIVLYAAVSKADDTQRAETAILHLVNGSASHPITKEPSRATEYAGLFAVHGEKYGIPTLLLVAMSFLESSFRADAKGGIGESGLIQVVRQGRRACKPECGNDMDSPGVQICIGACWLDRIRQTCDSTLEQALTGYASGDCRSSNKRVNNAVRRRFSLWRKLEALK